MIRAEEATRLTHAAEYKNNQYQIDEIQEQILAAISDLKYYIVIEYELTEPTKSYLCSLGYSITKQKVNPFVEGLDFKNNYYYTIRWPR